MQHDRVHQDRARGPQGDLPLHPGWLRGAHRHPRGPARPVPGTVTTLVKRLADRGLVDHRPYQGVTFTDDGPPGGGGRHPPPPHRRALPRRHVGLRLERGRRAGRVVRARPARRGRSSGSSWRCTGRRPARTASRSRSPRPPTCPTRPSSTTSSRATWPRWPCRDRPTPRSCRSSARSASCPGVEVAVVEKHPFDGPLVVEIDGQTRTIGERVARQVYVTRTLDAGAPGRQRVNGRTTTGPS